MMNKLSKLLTFLIISSLVFSPISSFAKNIKAPAAKTDNEDGDQLEGYESENTVEIYDPLEKVNRKIYKFNDTLDRYVLEPVAITYRKTLHKEVRKSIRNFLTNLYAPFSALNSVFQGKPDNALASFSNFLINSTVGIGGIFDVASRKGIVYRKEDFGQTLGYYGLSSGAYLMLPIFGPSSSRDLGGMLVDKSINPIEFNLLEFGGESNLIDTEYRVALATLAGIDKRESLINIIEDIRKDSFDPYATIRSAYLQQRIAEIKN